MERDTGITLGIGFLTGLRGTPLWFTIAVSAGIAVFANEIARSNPELLPGYKPKEGDKIVQDMAVGFIGWWAGKTAHASQSL